MDIRIFDAPGSFIRYTVVIDRGNGSKEFYSMSDNPHHSNGLNIFCGTSTYGYKERPHLGKRLKGIPKGICEAVKNRVSNNGIVLEKVS